MKIKLTKKNLKILEKGFENAPKTYEEALKAGKLEPIPKGMKYADFNKESEILKKVLYQHEEKICSCDLGNPCHYNRYLHKEITISDIIAEIIHHK